MCIIVDFQVQSLKDNRFYSIVKKVVNDMFELTNEQRKCFALVPVSDQWECIEAKASPYDQFKTYLFIDGDTIVK